MVDKFEKQDLGLDQIKLTCRFCGRGIRLTDVCTWMSFTKSSVCWLSCREHDGGTVVTGKTLKIVSSNPTVG